MIKDEIRWLYTLVLFCLIFLAVFTNNAVTALPADKENSDQLPEATGLNITADLDDEKNWHAMQVSTNYVKLKDIRPNAVPEIKLNFPIDGANSIMKETMDGFLCGSKATLALSGTKYPKSLMRLQKLDQEGKVVWEREYGPATFSGRMNNLLVNPDGSFLFTVQTYPYWQENGPVQEKSMIIKCNQKGEEVWRQEFADYAGELLRCLFRTENNEILVVGQERYADGKQNSGGVDDIMVMKLDADGRIIAQKNYGGSDFDILNMAIYDQELGLILSGRTQSKDGEFALSRDERSVDFIARIDQNLNFKWVVQAKEKESFIYDQLAVAGGYVFVLVQNRTGDAFFSGYLIRLDREGNRNWTTPPLYTGIWGRAMSVLAGGDIAVAAGQQNQGIIVILDPNGQEKQRLEDLKFSAKDINPTTDGGFIVTAQREIKCVPQPLYVSSIWYDTELVATRYNQDYTIAWRKTYDRYKNSRGMDYVFPLANGKLIVENGE